MSGIAPSARRQQPSILFLHAFIFIVPLKIRTNGVGTGEVISFVLIQRQPTGHTSEILVKFIIYTAFAAADGLFLFIHRTDPHFV